MFNRAIGIIRVVLIATWAAATLSLFALMAMPHVLPMTGREMYVVRGGSMEPAMPIGSVVVVQHVDPTQLAVGDIITFTAANQTTVTHRIVEVVTGAQQGFETKGDANGSNDSTIVPAPSVTGRVEYVVPGLGVAITLLASTLGSLAAIGILGGLLLAVWFIDELQSVMRRSARGRAAVAEPAH
jgi:signal peptidase